MGKVYTNWPEAIALASPNGKMVYTVSLHCDSGSSNKVYMVSIIYMGGSFNNPEYNLVASYGPNKQYLSSTNILLQHSRYLNDIIKQLMTTCNGKCNRGYHIEAIWDFKNGPISISRQDTSYINISANKAIQEFETTYLLQPQSKPQLQRTNIGFYSLGPECLSGHHVEVHKVFRQPYQMDNNTSWRGYINNNKDDLYYAKITTGEPCVITIGYTVNNDAILSTRSLITSLNTVYNDLDTYESDGYKDILVYKSQSLDLIEDCLSNDLKMLAVTEAIGYLKDNVITLIDCLIWKGAYIYETIPYDVRLCYTAQLINALQYTELRQQMTLLHPVFNIHGITYSELTRLMQSNDTQLMGVYRDYTYMQGFKRPRDILITMR